jgi:SAM-dependent methyltransferase
MTPGPGADDTTLEARRPSPTRSIDYDRLGHGYARHRRADPRIAAHIHAALGDARTVVNVGAGAGSYEPTDRYVLAIEPSATMRAQRTAHLSPAIAGRAEALPLDNRSVDAAMAILTVHHWDDPLAGLRELRRVARYRVIMLTFDIDVLARYWLFTDYLPEGLADDRARFPAIAVITHALGGAEVEAVAVPADCSDGFVECYYARPEALLDPSVRAAQSVWPRLPEGVEERAIAALAADLDSGEWDRRHGHLRNENAYDAALRLITATP